MMYLVSHNRQMDGVLDYLNSRNMTDGGPVHSDDDMSDDERDIRCDIYDVIYDIYDVIVMYDVYDVIYDVYDV